MPLRTDWTNIGTGIPPNLKQPPNLKWLAIKPANNLPEETFNAINKQLYKSDDLLWCQVWRVIPFQIKLLMKNKEIVYYI